MTAPSESAIHGDVAGRWPKAVQDFALHDRNMHAGGRPAGREDLLHVRGVLLGIQLFVLVVKRSRIPAGDSAGAARAQAAGQGAPTSLHVCDVNASSISVRTPTPVGPLGMNGLFSSAHAVPAMSR